MFCNYFRSDVIKFDVEKLSVKMKYIIICVFLLRTCTTQTSRLSKSSPQYSGFIKSLLSIFPYFSFFHFAFSLILNIIFIILLLFYFVLFFFCYIFNKNFSIVKFLCVQFFFCKEKISSRTIHSSLFKFVVQ